MDASRAVADRASPMLMSRNLFHTGWLAAIAVIPVFLVLAATGCQKQTATEELDKAVVALEKVEKTPGVPAGDYDPSMAPPAQQMKQAITDYKSGKMEDAVTRLQLLRAQTALSPQQRMALQDSIAAVMAEIYALAEKGDARAAAAVAQYEKMQTAR